LAMSCGVFLFVSLTGGFGAPGPLIFVFASGASMAGSLTGHEVIGRVLATALVAALAWAVCAASEALRHHPAPERALPTEPELLLNHRLAAAARTIAGA